jgi:uncharacterized membrane-anchored protein YhcB (DUF1043 family)
MEQYVEMINMRLGFGMCAVACAFAGLAYEFCVFRRTTRKTITEQQTQLDDLKRELEEMKRKIQ